MDNEITFNQLYYVSATFNELTLKIFNDNQYYILKTTQSKILKLKIWLCTVYVVIVSLLLTHFNLPH